MDTPDDWNAVYIDGLRVELTELASGRRRMFEGGRELHEVTAERISTLKQRLRRLPHQGSRESRP